MLYDMGREMEARTDIHVDGGHYLLTHGTVALVFSLFLVSLSLSVCVSYF